jgi:hypothetical protein
MENKPRYLVIGGNVISKTDAQEHYISAKRLCELYGLNWRKPNITLIEDDNDYKIRGLDMSKFVVLRPRYDGNYQLEVE